MTQQELARTADVDTKTIWNLETKGRWPIARSRARIEKALGWPQGELERIASEQERREPALIPEDDWERAILADPDLTDGDKRTMITRSRKIRNEMYPAGRSAPAAAAGHDDQREPPGAAAS